MDEITKELVDAMEALLRVFVQDHRDFNTWEQYQDAIRAIEHATYEI